MAEASRFPHLALPFAIVGAAGGWLSASLVSNPLVQRFRWDLEVEATLVAAAFAGLAGALLTRWCRRDPLAYVLDPSDSEAAPRPATDRWPLQALVVLAAGTLTGAIVASALDVYNGLWFGALAGLGCAAAFVPVCLAVIAAARRARRARLGSLVSDSDRRAVWGILATALSVATLEALPAWPAAAAGEGSAPVPAAVMLGAAALVIAGILVADGLGLRRARRELAPGLVARDPTSLASTDVEAPRLDLGLGDDLAARIARTAAAYRGRDRTLALVQGDPEQAISAFRRALARGGACLSIVALAAGAHALAREDTALLMYDERRCEGFEFPSCERLADAHRQSSPLLAMELYAKACGATAPESCVSLGEMYMAGYEAIEQSVPRKPNAAEQALHARAMEYFGRACRYGVRKGCIAMAR